MAPSRVAVVGAGLAGLSAALELKRSGFAVDLFERSRLLGGKATSFEVDGIEVDNGQHVFLGCCSEFLEFARGLPLESGPDGSAASVLFLQEHFDALLLARGKPPGHLRAVSAPAPFHLLPALLSYSHLDLRSKLQICRALVQAYLPPRPADTFAAWLERHGQGSVTRRAFWDPFLVPALNAVPEEVSAESALFVIKTAFLGSQRAACFGYSKVPLARLAAAAASRIDQVYLRTPVIALDIEYGAGGRRLRGLALEHGRRMEYDAAVLAVPPHRLPRLMGNVEDFGLYGLEQFRMAAIVDVHLWFDTPPLAFDFAAVLDSPVQWVFQKSPGYLCCSMSAAGRYLDWPNTDLIELCRSELAAVIPSLQSSVLLRGAATRDREATFVPSIGLRRPGPATNCHGLAVAGAWTDTGWPATMESAARSGRIAAGFLRDAFTSSASQAARSPDLEIGACPPAAAPVALTPTPEQRIRVAMKTGENLKAGFTREIRGN